jgi:hypothetical protein
LLIVEEILVLVLVERSSSIFWIPDNSDRAALCQSLVPAAV